jgi:hypothetical protein
MNSSVVPLNGTDLASIDSLPLYRLLPEITVDQIKRFYDAISSFRVVHTCHTITQITPTIASAAIQR